MKKYLIITLFAIISSMAVAQDNSYMVFFTDKNDTSFDPYSYFDAKAIARYEKCGADLYDISNYPVNDSYKSIVNNYVSDIYGESRWLNAIGVMTTAANAEIISQMPFVANVQEIESSGFLASVESEEKDIIAPDSYGVLTDQLRRFGGELFVEKGINGKGLRICILDGGFPGVDEHVVFKHLRDNKQIIATYNFPNKKEDVYGWSSHGTMVLSCIAGITEDGKMLGLATGAEFLLARTEINPEPFKEEIWWAMGAEWADKNGADIINSSLGYGKDRYWTRDMDGTSYVAKAANEAVKKGILICNSAGNEGDDSHWMTIVTPSDAENVLCVGGIEDNLDDYKHIEFSSYGPTADKRRKPNVVAFGHATVANPKGGLTEVDGTSFSSPLTAGFAACAWQTKRDLTALQMKEEIEKSCDLYPYFNYALGYGVPQASYFINGPREAKASFTLETRNDEVCINIPEIIRYQYVFINVEDENGVLIGYYQIKPDSRIIVLKNKELGQGKKLNVYYNGYYASCDIKGDGEEIKLFADDKNSQNGTFKKVEKENWMAFTYLQYDYNIPLNPWNGTSQHWGLGTRHYYGKAYKVGLGLGIGFNRYTSTDSLPETLKVDGRKTMIKSFQITGELLQRVIIRRIGVYWDLGAYVSYNSTRKVEITDKIIWKDGEDHNYADKATTTYTKAEAVNVVQYGAVTRIGYTLLGQINLSVYGCYRLSDVVTKKDPLIGIPDKNPSPWSIGIDVELKL